MGHGVWEKGAFGPLRAQGTGHRVKKGKRYAVWGPSARPEPEQRANNFRLKISDVRFQKKWVMRKWRPITRIAPSRGRAKSPRRSGGNPVTC